MTDEESVLIAVSTAQARCLAQVDGVTIHDIFDSFAGDQSREEIELILEDLYLAGKLDCEGEGEERYWRIPD